MASSPGSTTREQLKQALQAAGLESSDERVEILLPAYEGMRSGAERLRALELGDTEPAIIFRLPPPPASPST